MYINRNTGKLYYECEGKIIERRINIASAAVNLSKWRYDSIEKTRFEDNEVNES